MNHQQMWELYCQETNSRGEYDFWSFGDQPDQLARLVLDEIKTGTSSLYLWYERENEPLPEVGTYSVILDSREEAVCIIRTTGVNILAFSDVSESHAYREGEGDRSLDYWRRVHEEFFSEELEKEGLSFDPRMRVVCEEFEKVYP